MICFFSFLFFHLLKSTESENSNVINSKYSWAHLPPTPDLPSPQSGQYVQINHINIWYTIYGPNDGAPILFLHGGLANSNYWGLQVEHFQNKYKCILMDSRGQGRSSSSSDNLTYDLMTSDVIGLLDYLNINRIHLIGWSDGADIGLNLAMNYPQRLCSLFAFGAHYKAGDNNGNTPPLFATYLKRTQIEYEIFNPNKQYEILFNNLLQMWTSSPDKTKMDFEKIPLDLPIWIVGADHDEFINREQPDTMASWIPQSGELILPQTSHFAFLQQPIVFNRVLEEFLNEVTSSTTCSEYRFSRINNCSIISNNSFYILMFIFTSRLIFKYVN